MIILNKLKIKCLLNINYIDVDGQPDHHPDHQQQAEPVRPEHLHPYLLYPHPLQTR